MEGPEDDAGGATNASRRASAREKNAGGPKDGGANVCVPAEPSEAGASSETASISEEAFDGDSVPSPSAQDVNTSTEAILDMIDEIVEGPGATKRRSLSSENTNTVSMSANTSDSAIHEPDLKEHKPDANLLEPSGPSLSASTECERLSQETTTDNQPQCEAATGEPTDGLPNPRLSASAPSEQVAESTLPRESLEQPELQLTNDGPPNIPSSSIVVSLHSESDISESDAYERTIKCVSSSNIRDLVTVESAESTSNDSVSESRSSGPVQAETSTRSPLRRRLVRPAPQDRRPDSTVSSTADTSNSQNDDIHSVEQTPSDSVTKDVSSSSDAVPPVYGSDKPEEIRNVSEISVCKAETSMNPPKKIKLVRHKTATVMPSPSKESGTEECVTQPEGDQCQSTSTECPSVVLPENSSSDLQKVSTVECANVNAVVDNVNKIPENVKESLPETSSIYKDSISPSPTSDSLFKMPSISQVEGNQNNLSLTTQNTPETDLHVASTSEAGESVEPLKVEKPEMSESVKQVPKLTIKLGSKQQEEVKCAVPKLTIKPIRPPTDKEVGETLGDTQIQCVTKLNIKPIPKPAERINDIHRKSSSSEISESESSENDESTGTSDQASVSDQGPTDMVPKVTIKLGKPGTDSEGKFYTEPNIPKLTIRGGQSHHVITQPEKNQIDKLPKLTIKAVSKIDSNQPISPKLTIKPIIKPPEITGEVSSDEHENQPHPKLKVSTESLGSSLDLMPKITIKPVIKPDESTLKIPKRLMAISEVPENIPIVTKLNIKPILKPEEFGETSENYVEKVPIVSKLNIKPIVKPSERNEESEETDEKVPKVTIKPILKPKEKDESEITDIPIVSKLNIKPILKPNICDISQNCEVPVVSKLNIKPVLKHPDPIDSSKNEEKSISKLNIKPIIKPVDGENIVSKLNIKPIVKPKDNDTNTHADEVPKITKLNIKPLKNPPDSDCDAISGRDLSVVPIVTKLNIKPILKPTDEDVRDSENQSSETGNSSDDYGDHIPVVTKINIKPILKPNDSEELARQCSSNEVDMIPVVSKLNIKPLVKPDDGKPSSPKRYADSKSVPIVTKLNIKPIVKPEELDSHKDSASKIPPLKINLSDRENALTKAIRKEDNAEHLFNNINENITIVSRLNIKPLVKPVENSDSSGKIVMNCKSTLSNSMTDIIKSNCIPDDHTMEGSADKGHISNEKSYLSFEHKTETGEKVCEDTDKSNSSLNTTTESKSVYHKAPAKQNCVLLKRLLETKKDGLDNRLDSNDCSQTDKTELEMSTVEPVNCEQLDKVNSDCKAVSSKDNDIKNDKKSIMHQRLDIIERLTKPLEINISEKSNQNSGQDSPRIILKINKTDHGSSAKIITEEIKRPETPIQNDTSENTQEEIEKQATKKKFVNSRKKQDTLVDPSVPMGKRLRSSRIVDNSEKTPATKRQYNKRPSTDPVTPQSKEPELSVLETKRLKLGQLLSDKSLSITMVPSNPEEVSPPKKADTPNQTVVKNENCSNKNGNSKLHNILTNLQAKQAQTLSYKEIKCSVQNTVTSELECSTSTGSSDVVEVPIENSHHELQEMIINENSESRDFALPTEERSQDPLEVIVPVVLPVEMSTPQPKKRGRPRKLPVSEGAKPAPLPVPALEERPQRSLRLTRERPAILVKPRGRGRGRGARRTEATVATTEDTIDSATKFFNEELSQNEEDIDPTSSRIKLPRMTEALDNMPGGCNTPLSSRKRSSSGDGKFETSELKVVLDGRLPPPPVEWPGGGESGEAVVSRGRGSRGGRGRGRPGRSPRRSGRGRGGGRGAMYMKETMGIYGRVCGPATTTVQLFEEETCMMDDNATPAKPSHLLDDDSQSSVLSSTNESSRTKKLKYEELFDSNKVWTAADVKEYIWPPPQVPDVERHVMMIQEQVAMFLNVKSFKRRYPELQRRAVTGDERDHVLARGLVSQPLADLGITAVDASEVLDIMLSDYPHKYEEYRSHQRQKQLADASSEDTTQDTKSDVKVDKVEMKIEMKPAEVKPEPSKLDLEKSRQDMAAAAAAAASEWNARLNASRRAACVDLQTLTVLRPRVGPVPAVGPTPAVPPAGLYPHALLPGQYQHSYRVYTPEQLRYFPLNTVLAAPPAPASPPLSSTDTEPDSGSGSDSDGSATRRLPAKRKKLTKSKRSSHNETSTTKEETKEAGEVDTCRACKLRLEANRKYTHERFLVCSVCNAKLHPGCVELGADTIRKCREYAWQCAECKSCGACALPADDDKMLFCDLCDRGFHIYCVGLKAVPSGRWHCVECAVCKSCGARDPNGPTGVTGTPGTPGTPMGSVGTPGGSASTPGGSASTPGSALGCVTPAGGAEWHHQTRRGPGGHKVYSHSLCTPCARAYRIGRYCPLCDRSFIGPKGTMQLVICKLCDRQLHQDCVRQTVSSLNVLDYTCGDCRRGGITSRAAAARLAPRTIATLFMAKRRFNKYAHKQYMQSRLQARSLDNSCDAAGPEPTDRADDASDDDAPDPTDPLDTAEVAPEADEAAAAVAALQMDFAD